MSETALILFYSIIYVFFLNAMLVMGYVWYCEKNNCSCVPRFYRMIHKNIENIKEYDIDRNWYKNRKQGISAVVRTMGDDDKIKDCVMGCIELFDEILVVDTPVEGDKTKTILEDINSSKIKYLIYPFKITKTRVDKKHWSNIKKNLFQRICYSLCNVFTSPCVKRGSVHSFAYMTNWCMSKTSYCMVAPQWDADHILMPEFNNKKTHDMLLGHGYVKVCGLNVINDEVCGVHPLHPRFFYVNRWLFFPGHVHMGESSSYRVSVSQVWDVYNWFLFPFQQLQFLVHRLRGLDFVYYCPMFWHMKDGVVHPGKANFEESIWKWNVKRKIEKII